MDGEEMNLPMEVALNLQQEKRHGCYASNIGSLVTPIQRVRMHVYSRYKTEMGGFVALANGDEPPLREPLAHQQKAVAHASVSMFKTSRALLLLTMFFFLVNRVKSRSSTQGFSGFESMAHRNPLRPDSFLMDPIKGSLQGMSSEPEPRDVGSVKVSKPRSALAGRRSFYELESETSQHSPFLENIGPLVDMEVISLKNPSFGVEWSEAAAPLDLRFEMNGGLSGAQINSNGFPQIRAEDTPKAQASSTMDSPDRPLNNVEEIDPTGELEKTYLALSAPRGLRSSSRSAAFYGPQSSDLRVESCEHFDAFLVSKLPSSVAERFPSFVQTETAAGNGQPYLHHVHGAENLGESEGEGNPRLIVEGGKTMQLWNEESAGEAASIQDFLAAD